MSWIKKTMGRLFGSQNENDEFEEPINDMNEQTQNQEANELQRPAFRFPMITDAEIYGWGEDSDEVTPLTKPIESPLREKPEEPAMPLFKNNRWPAEPPAGEIHRAGNKKKYQEVVEEPAERRFTPEKRKEEIKTERVSKPFKPTEVPSPVYGFAQQKPRPVPGGKKPVEHELPMWSRSSEDPPFLTPSTEVLPSGKPVYSNRQRAAEAESHSALSNVEKEEWKEMQENTARNLEKHEAYEVESVDEYAAAVIESAENTAVEVIEDSPAVEASVELDEHSYSPTESYNEPFSTSSETKQERTEPVAEQVAVLDREKDDEPESEVIIQPLSEEKDSELAAIEENGTELPQPEVESSEKIVPFNVVMLKSDKEREQLRKMSQLHPAANADSAPSAGPIGNQAEPERAAENVRNAETAYKETATEYKDNELEKSAAPLAAPIVTEQPLQSEEEQEALSHYVHPSIADLLPPEEQREDTEWLTSQSEKLVEALSHFSVQAEILEAVQGPTVTRFELTVGFGTKVSKIRNLTDDLKLALAAEDIRIQAPIPGTSSIGIEIPNRTTRPVHISEVIDTEKFMSSDSPLEAVLGLSLTGEPVTLDLRKMPHGMIAGATGSGKSVCINSILVSLLYKASPTELKMMLIDPKMVELAPFNGIPHLISPVITDVKAATAALKWAVDEMERRYDLFAHAGARNIERYNQMAEANRQFSLKMPYLLIVIDELADLMMVAPADVEVSISRIAQKARACGIHLIIATQRPSVDVITGIIKANIPTRIAFAVSSQVDSRTIIDSVGAERLLGKGDMLYVGNGQSASIRLQGTFVTDDEIEQVIEHVKSEASPEYLFGQEDLLAAVVEEEESDPLFTQACSFIIEQGSASTSLLQRHFSIGYNRAAKLMDRMEAHGFISEQRGSRSRDVYLTESGLEAFLNPVPEA